MNKLVKEYDYKINMSKMIWPVLLFGAAAVFLFREAMTNDRGLIINGIITLDTGGATIFFYVLAGLSAGFVLLGILIGLSSLLEKDSPKVKLYDDRFEYPAGVLAKNDATAPTAGKKTVYKQVLYNTMASVNLLDIYKTRIIEVTTTENKKHSLVDSKFKTRQELEEVFNFLYENRVK